jgi:hypothetical protein
MASVVGWWAIPAVALLAIVLWTSWHGRTRGPQGMRGSVAEYERFQKVLTRVVEVDPHSAAGADRDGSLAEQPRAAGRRDVP